MKMPKSGKEAWSEQHYSSFEVYAISGFYFSYIFPFISIITAFYHLDIYLINN